jgi:hypothetical protein
MKLEPVETIARTTTSASIIIIIITREIVELFTVLAC